MTNEGADLTARIQDAHSPGPGPHRCFCEVSDPGFCDVVRLGLCDVVRLGTDASTIKATGGAVIRLRTHRSSFHRSMEATAARHVTEVT